MSTNTIDDDRIGPSIDLEDVALPARIGERFETLYGTGTRPTTVAEWIDSMAGALEDSLGRTPTVEDLCTTDDGVHSFESAGGDEYQEYVCVLDPIAYPFLTGTPGTITSTTPLREATITVEIDDAGVDLSSPDAIVSLGISNDVEAVEQVTPETVYRRVCGYIQTFEDEAEYAEWADDVDAVTTTVTVETGIATAGAISRVLFA